LRDVREIYELRLRLEPPAAAAAAGRIAPPELERLRALSGPALDLDDPASIDHFMAANRAVHVTVAAAAGNQRAAGIVARLLDDSERARLVALRGGAAGRGRRARAEHKALLDALEAGDGVEAARLMAEAIRAFSDEVLDALRVAVQDAPLPAA
jgi:GntR family transcriptional repressor for pyruvate dehydrogenase complex